MEFLSLPYLTSLRIIRRTLPTWTWPLKSLNPHIQLSEKYKYPWASQISWSSDDRSILPSSTGALHCCSAGPPIAVWSASPVGSEWDSCNTYITWHLNWRLTRISRFFLWVHLCVSMLYRERAQLAMSWAVGLMLTVYWASCRNTWGRFSSSSYTYKANSL